MSRIGKIPVNVPDGVKARIEERRVHLEGSHGKLFLDIPDGIKVEYKESGLFVNRPDGSGAETKQNRANHGTTRALLNNMIEGVTKGHKKELEIHGIGFRAQMQENKLILNLGLSHPVEYEVTKGVKVSVVKATSITVVGADKALVGQVAAQIRDFKRPEPYKGKGIRYVGEVVRRKQGKSVK